MKKLILASAIAAIAANSATAATIYDDKGLTFKIKGDWQVQLRDNASPSKDAEVEYDDLELKNSITYDLGNGLKAFGQLDFGFKDAAEGKQAGDKLEEAYVGLKASNISVLVGKTDNAADDFGVEGAYENGIGDDIFDEFGSGKGDDMIRADFDFDAVTVAVSHELAAEGEDSENGESTEIYVEAGFEAFTLGAAIQNYKPTPSSASEDIWGVSAAFDAGFAEFAVDYGEADQGTGDDVSFTNLVATFKPTKQVKVNVGYAQIDYDADASNDEDQIYANATYKFPAQKNVSFIAEISQRDDDAGTDYDTDILVGMRIKF